MIKKIFYIWCIAIFIISANGCSEKNRTDKATNEIEQTVDENADSNKEEVDTASRKNETLPDYFKQKDNILLKGKINNKLDIHMELKITNKKYFNDLGERSWMHNASMAGEKPEIMYDGFYYYDQYMKNIRIEAEAYSNGYFTIYEFDENNEYSDYFGGFLESGNILKGRWDNNKGTDYPFYLVESTATTNGLDLKLDTNKIGNYYTKGSNSDNYYECLNIVAVTDKKFKFHISGYSKPNYGNIGGVAYYTDESKKEATFDDGDNCKINFNFDGNTIKVSGTGINYYAGAHVCMDGIFEKRI